MFKSEFEQYISVEKRFSKHTIKSYLTDLDQFSSYIDINFEIQDNLNKINFQIIRSWIASMLEKGISPRSQVKKAQNRKVSS